VPVQPEPWPAFKYQLREVAHEERVERVPHETLGRHSVVTAGGESRRCRRGATGWSKKATALAFSSYTQDSKSSMTEKSVSACLSPSSTVERGNHSGAPES